MRKLSLHEAQPGRAADVPQAPTSGAMDGGPSLRVQLWSYNYDPEPTGIGPVSRVLAEGCAPGDIALMWWRPIRTIRSRGGGFDGSPTVSCETASPCFVSPYG